MSTDDERVNYLADGAGDLDDAERVEFDEVRALLTKSGMWDEPASDLEDRVVTAIIDASAHPTETQTRHEAQSRDAWSETATDVDTPTSPLVADLDAARGRRRRSSALLAAAAAFIVVASAAVVVVGGGGGDDAETFTMSLEPTELAPSVTGEITLTKTTSGWEYALDVSGFERLDNGRFYEAWVKSDDGILVPIGTFNEGTGVVLWSGVPPVEFPTLTVTEESADGDQASSGQLVLVAVLDD